MAINATASVACLIVFPLAFSPLNDGTRDAVLKGQEHCRDDARGQARFCLGQAFDDRLTRPIYRL
jgi:hypothetical protein